MNQHSLLLKHRTRLCKAVRNSIKHLKLTIIATIRTIAPPTINRRIDVIIVIVTNGAAITKHNARNKHHRINNVKITQECKTTAITTDRKHKRLLDSTEGAIIMTCIDKVNRLYS